MVGAVEFGIRVLECVEVLAQAGKTDDVESCAACPAAHFNYWSIFYVLNWIFFVDDFGNCLSHFSGLGPEDSIQVLHMTIVKGWHQILPLNLYFFFN